MRHQLFDQIIEKHVTVLEVQNAGPYRYKVISDAYSRDLYIRIFGQRSFVYREIKVAAWHSSFKCYTARFFFNSKSPHVLQHTARPFNLAEHLCHYRNYHLLCFRISGQHQGLDWVYAFSLVQRNWRTNIMKIASLTSCWWTWRVSKIHPRFTYSLSNVPTYIGQPNFQSGKPGCILKMHELTERKHTPPWGLSWLGILQTWWGLVLLESWMHLSSPDIFAPSSNSDATWVGPSVP